MRHAWTADQIRAAEAPLLAQGVPLMRRAAHAVAAAVRSAVPDGAVLVLVGGGNNGGDGLYAAAELAAERTVTVVLTRPIEAWDPLPTRPGIAVEPRAAGPEDGLCQARVAGATVLDLTGEEPDWDELEDSAVAAAVWVDALTGIGLRPPVRGRIGQVISRAERLRDRLGAGAPLVVAVDVPSGLDSDTGAVEGAALAADLTVTFGGAKPALLLPPAALLAGAVEVVPLDLDGLAPATAALARVEPDDLAALWSVPGPDDHKYTRGVLGVVAGSATYPGAAVLAVTAAVRTGVGMVRYLGTAGERVLAARPEAVVAAGRVQAYLVGPGLGDPEELDHDDPDTAAAARAAVEAAAEEDLGLVLDAGGLAFVGVTDLPERTVLTPHAGELSALLRRVDEPVSRAEIESDPARWAVHAAAATGVTVLLKGAVTVVAGPDGALWSQADGTPWLATAGAGDVLAGVLGALLAQQSGADPARLAALAALVHGRAARLASGGGPVAALDVADAVSRVIADGLRR